MLLRPLQLVIIGLEIAGLAIFASGFFPYKPTLSGFSSSLFRDDNSIPPFDKVVFMVIDALRSDFVFSNQSSMLFTQSLLKDKYALGFTAYSAPPTVTLPRLKALTTGSLPNFLDALVNVAESDSASSLAFKDSWLMQLVQHNKSIHMFGDDTWLRLFPNFFSESDGTSSFFVSDFTEVDNNVTRHIDEQLENQNEWDALILHYLGLDHIGHKGGPNSKFMPEKQREMDQIIHKLFDSLDDNTLLVVCGDHGMNEAGNHGGSSPGETSAALVFISKGQFHKSLEQPEFEPILSPDMLYLERVDQTDLVPTLSILLGLPIPKNSMGVVIPRVLTAIWPKDLGTIARHIRENVAQVSAIFSEAFGYDSIVDAILSNEKSTDSQDVIDLGYKFLNNAQQRLSRTSSSYNLTKMRFGVAILFIAVLLSIGQLITLPKSINMGALCTIVIIHGLTMFGSSTVEEEHHFWYWICTGWITYQFIKSLRDRKKSINWVLIMGLFSILRRWNQTGQKHAGEGDIASLLSLYPNVLWSLIISTYAWVGYNISNSLGRGWWFAPVVTTVLAIGPSIIFKINMGYEAGDPMPYWIAYYHRHHHDTDLATQARLSFGGLIFMLLLCSRIKRKLVLSLVSVFFLNQLKTTNMPLIMIFSLIQYLIPNRQQQQVTYFLLCQASFFAMGNSNSLSSLDLSNSYNGIKKYNAPLVGILLFISNFIGPLYWICARDSSNNKLSSIYYSISTLAVVSACYLLRSHLFIWTVFSPKLLYIFAWTGVFQVVDFMF